MTQQSTADHSNLPPAPSTPDWKARATARVSASILERLRRGEPWVFQDGLRDDGELRQALPQGGWVRLSSGGGRQGDGGLALYDPDNPIALRVLDASREPVPPRPVVRRRVALAYQVRAPLLANGQTTAVRIFHGEGDRMAGLVADYYDGLLVFRPDCAAWMPYLEAVAGGLSDHLPVRGIACQWEGELRWLGEPLPLPQPFLENGLPFVADPSVGQKTGFFLDMRPNRDYIGGQVAGLKVLNLFCYTGAFTSYALRGGAARVVSVDSAQKAVEAARQHAESAGFPASEEEFITADAFEYLEALPEVGRKGQGDFDLIILDPPSFTHSKKTVPKALEGYRRLNALALSRLGSGQYLATASCSSRVTSADFSEAVDDAARTAKRRLRLLYAHGAGPDHPTAAGSGLDPYLKFHHYMVE